MTKCPTCGEQIDDGFDSCWKCAKAGPVQEPADGSRANSQRRGFWCAWRRGWLVLLMVLVCNVVGGLVTLLFEHSQGLSTAAGLGAVIIFLPVFAYWIFNFFFGEETW